MRPYAQNASDEFERRPRLIPTDTISIRHGGRAPEKRMAFPAVESLIGPLLACPRKGLRLRKSANVTTKFVCRGGWSSGGGVKSENLLMTDFFWLVVIALSPRQFIGQLCPFVLERLQPLPV